MGRGYAALVSPGGRVLGIDASEAMLAVARDRAAGRDGRFWMSVTMTTVVARRPG